MDKGFDQVKNQSISTVILKCIQVCCK